MPSSAFGPAFYPARGEGTWIRSVLLAVLGLLCVGAAPAQATLLVRSDGNGLFVSDKNGLSDSVFMDGGTLNNQPAYRVRNDNTGDIFDFDFQFGCQDNGDRKAICQRNGPQINIQLAGGSDHLNMGVINNTLTSPPLPTGESSVAGGTGNDRVIGHAGRDQLHGQTGEDHLTGFSGNDVLDGGDNSDRLEGDSGNDTLKGEDGSDVLLGGLGTDLLSGNPGNDFINAREPSGSGVADEIGCGGGADFLEADSKDVVPASCEEFERSPVGETPHVDVLGRTLRVATNGRARVRLRCPRGVGSLGCKGTLRARGSGGRTRRVRYSIRAGRRKTVPLRFSSRPRRFVTLTSVESGRKGRKTTVRRLRVR